MPERKDRPVPLETVDKVVVSQLADGRAVVSVHAETIRHFIAGTLYLSRRKTLRGIKR